MGHLQNPVFGNCVEDALSFVEAICVKDHASNLAEVRSLVTHGVHEVPRRGTSYMQQRPHRYIVCTDVAALLTCTSTTSSRHLRTNTDS